MLRAAACCGVLRAMLRRRTACDAAVARCLRGCCVLLRAAAGRGVQMRAASVASVAAARAALAAASVGVLLLLGAASVCLLVAFA